VPKKLLRVSQDPIIGFKAAQFASVKTFGVVGQIGLDLYQRVSNLVHGR